MTRSEQKAAITLRRGRPPYEDFGHESSFEDLPEDCQRLVLDAYMKLWNL